MERFFRYIEEMRTRPLPERRRFALTTAFIFTSCIALVWAFLILPRSIRQAGEDAPKTDIAESLRSESSKPKQDATSLFAEMQKKYNEAKKGIGNAAGQIASTSTATSTEPSTAEDVPPPPPAAPSWQ